MSCRLHLDTDFAGDPDDACALAMLLGSPDVDVIGITTSLEDGGRRHDCVRFFLDLACQADIPTASGFDQTLTQQRFDCTWSDPDHWPEQPLHAPSTAGAALDLLTAAIESDATVLAIGGFTNLAALELSRPGSLIGVRVVAMAGWVDDPPAFWPQWGPSMDFNTQCDTRAARIVANSGAALTLVTLPVAMRVTLREGHLPRLRASGRVGALLARQSERHQQTSGLADLARDYASLPVDLVNFHWDPVAAGVALGWDCIVVRPTTITAVQEAGVVAFRVSGDEGTDRISMSVDAPDFEERWMQCVERIAGLDI